MALPTPDLAGFRDAMNTLRSDFGQDVAFRVPQAKVWPPGTPIDPETGEPYNPAIDPVSGGDFTDVVKHVGVITKPISPMRDKADTRFEAGGAFSGMDAVLDLAAADYADVQDATRATLYGEHFNVVEMRPSGLGGPGNQVDRYIVSLERR